MDYEQDEQEEQFEEQAAEPQAEDMEIDEDDAPYLDLQFYSLLLELFFLFVLLIIRCSRCWCRFGGMMRARLTL